MCRFSQELNNLLAMLSSLPWVLIITSSLSAYILSKMLLGYYSKFKNYRLVKKKHSLGTDKRQKMLEKLSGLRSPVVNHEKFCKLPFHVLKEKISSNEIQIIDLLEAFQFSALTHNQKFNFLTDMVYDSDVSALFLESLDSSERGPLHGIPISLKDMVGLKGYDAPFGMSTRIFSPRREDSVIVQVLKEQGALPFAVTNMSHIGLCTDTSNPVYGETKNPHNSTRTSGGSSGGEGAILGSGASILGFGTDIGGSIRIPSHYCGICGLKPTNARISTLGLADFKPYCGTLRPCVGPMARDVNTLVVCMRALLCDKMYDKDPGIPRLPFNEELFRSKKKLRVGYFTSLGIDLVDPVPAVVRGVHLAKSALESRGHEVVAFGVPKAKKLIYEFLIKNLIADGGHSIMEKAKGDLSDQSTHVSLMLCKIPNPIKKLIAALIYPILPFHANLMKSICGFSNLPDYFKMVSDLESFKIEFDNELLSAGIDALLCPVMPFPAPPVGCSSRVPMSPAFTAMFNVLDYPAGVVPVTKVTSDDVSACRSTYGRDLLHKYIAGFQEDSVGLPIGVQIAAPCFREEICLRLMGDIEQSV